MILFFFKGKLDDLIPMKIYWIILIFLIFITDKIWIFEKKVTI